jgi:ADP-heptose:LPS heptosyltransferase
MWRERRKLIGIRLLKSLFGTIEETAPTGAVPGSIAILAQERFGDVILLSPLLRILKRAVPAIRIAAVSVTSSADYLRYDANVDAVIRAKPPTLQALRHLSSQRFDMVFNTKDHPSFTFLYLTRRIRAARRVGIFHPLHEGFFDHMIRVDPLESRVKTNCALLDHLGIYYSEEDLGPYMPEGPVSKEVGDFAESIRGKRPVGVNLSASGAPKEWPVERWMDLLRRTAEPTVVVSMPKHLELKRALEGRFDHVIPSPPTRSIFDVGRVIEQLGLLVSTDTALIHVASCFDTPVLALYKIGSDLQRFPPLSTAQRTIVAPDADLGRISAEQVLELYGELV